jgi:flavin-dependent dehydrogenase
MNNKKIVIVGGGTAGWMTALYLRFLSNNYDITLIESEEIGILGAGEGSVPFLPLFLSKIGIKERDFLKHTNATFKIGINFENWRKDGRNYFHPFDVKRNETSYVLKRVEPNISKLRLSDLDVQYSLINLMANDDIIENSYINSILATNNKSPYVIYEGFEDLIAAYSYHFDATLTAKYLRSVAEERGVKRVEGIVTKINNDDNDYISSVICNDIQYDCDLIFDCTGFKRLIIGEHYNAKWKSYEDKLKVNTAIPFFLPIDDEIPTMTRSIAMDYGWMWQIPLQNRWGCGYIFDDNYIDVDTAKEEVRKYLGHDVEINRTIKFNAGRYEDVFVKNCVAVGLSAGFTEPLEATAIWTVMQSLTMLNQTLIDDVSEYRVKEFNKIMGNFNDDVVNFLHFHYLTNKDNTPFWSDYEKTTVKSEKLENYLNIWKERTPNGFDTIGHSNNFNLQSFLFVGYGLGHDIISKDLIKKENEIYQLNDKLKIWRDSYYQNLTFAESKSIDHRLHIEKLINL